MKAGTILHRFTARDGREVILRTPKWEDLDNFLEYINSLVEEGADIVRDKKVSRDQEADWLGTMLARLEKDERFSLVAEVDGKAISISELWRKKGYQNHVGELCIVIHRKYRNIGIGTQLMKSLISQAKTIDLKILTLEVYSTNKRAIHLYEKMGFKESGRIPKGIFRNGKYIDEVIMIKEIE